MRKIPRGKGYDKKSIGIHLQALKTDPHWKNKTGNQYARYNGLIPDFLYRSLEKYYFPEEWSIVWEFNKCEYCKDEFARSIKTQRFCSPKCASTQKRDKAYFGGNRKNTVGLAEGICQICGSMPAKGLASHHVHGKLNDPKGKVLVALCPGCHDVVTKLGGRVFVNTPEIWEKLIRFAHLRKYGPNNKLKVKVRIED